MALLRNGLANGWIGKLANAAVPGVGLSTRFIGPSVQHNDWLEHGSPAEGVDGFSGKYQIPVQAPPNPALVPVLGMPVRVRRLAWVPEFASRVDAPSAAPTPSVAAWAPEPQVPTRSRTRSSDLLAWYSSATEPPAVTITFVSPALLEGVLARRPAPTGEQFRDPLPPEFFPPPPGSWKPELPARPPDARKVEMGLVVLPHFPTPPHLAWQPEAPSWISVRRLNLAVAEQVVPFFPLPTALSWRPEAPSWISVRRLTLAEVAGPPHFPTPPYLAWQPEAPSWISVRRLTFAEQVVPFFPLPTALSWQPESPSWISVRRFNPAVAEQVLPHFPTPPYLAWQPEAPSWISVRRFNPAIGEQVVSFFPLPTALSWQPELAFVRRRFVSVVSDQANGLFPPQPTELFWQPEMLHVPAARKSRLPDASWNPIFPTPPYLAWRPEAPSWISVRRLTIAESVVPFFPLPTALSWQPGVRDLIAFRTRRLLGEGAFPLLPPVQAPVLWYPELPDLLVVPRSLRDRNQVLPFVTTPNVSNWFPDVPASRARRWRIPETISLPLSLPIDVSWQSSVRELPPEGVRFVVAQIAEAVGGVSPVAPSVFVRTDESPSVRAKGASPPSWFGPESRPTSAGDWLPVEGQIRLGRPRLLFDSKGAFVEVPVTVSIPEEEFFKVFAPGETFVSVEVPKEMVQLLMAPGETFKVVTLPNGETVIQVRIEGDDFEDV